MACFFRLLLSRTCDCMRIHIATTSVNGVQNKTNKHSLIVFKNEKFCDCDNILLGYCVSSSWCWGWCVCVCVFWVPSRDRFLDARTLISSRDRLLDARTFFRRMQYWYYQIPEIDAQTSHHRNSFRFSGTVRY